MILETERLILRPWDISDAGSLYEYARDPQVGLTAGWLPHRDVEESKSVIKNVLNGPECYAICLKWDHRAVGAIELMLKGHTDLTDQDDECELGYWLGRPFWGNGFMPEAAGEIIRHGFEDLSMAVIWCAYFDGNYQSRRVHEKCGFAWHHTTAGVDVPLLKETRTNHVNILTREKWRAQRG